MRARLFLSVALVAALALPSSALAKKKAAAAEEAAPTVLEGVEGIHGSWAKFQPEADRVMKSDNPKEMVGLFVRAMCARQLDKDLGDAMLGYIVLEKYQKSTTKSESGFVLMPAFEDEVKEVDRKPRILAGMVGGTPDNEYGGDAQMDLFKTCDGQLGGEYVDDGYSPRSQGITEKNGEPYKAKYFAGNAGASRSRPITLKHENGLWRVYDAAGLMTGVASTKLETEKKKAARE